MTDDLIFYTNPMSRGRIVRWMLEESQAPYRTEYLQYGGSMKEAPYLKINPMGKVPAIQHNNTVVTEAAAICAYLADAFPAAQLAPPIDQRGDYYRWLFFGAGPVEAAVTNRSLDLNPPDDKQAVVGYGDFDTVMNVLESKVADSGYLVGNKFSAADVYLGSQIGWGLQFGTMDKRPAFEAYWENISDRDAYRRANELDDAAMAEQS